MEKQNGGDRELPAIPEQHEQLRINSVVIPASDDEPIQQKELPVHGLTEYQAVVGGPIQAVDLAQPSMRLYCNEDGKVHEMPINRRATALLWGHNPAFRYQDVIVGDAFLVGPMSPSGVDTNVPDELVKVVEAEQLRVDIQVRGKQEWQPGEMRFKTWIEAYGYALRLMHGWLEAESFRVVPEA